MDNKLVADVDFALDDVAFSGYGVKEGGALQQVWVKPQGDSRLKRINETSEFVKAVLEKRRFYRVYLKDNETKEKLTRFMEGELK